jgi:hypothetical protein
MKKNVSVLFFPLLIVGILIALSGCYAPQITSAEVLFPAKQKNLSAQMDSVVLVNKSYLPLEQRNKTGVRYVGSYYQKSPQYLDSIISDNALYAFAHNLNIAPKGNTVKDDTIIRYNIADYTFMQPLPPKKVSRICSSTGAGMIISLEAFHSFDSLYRYTEAGYYVSERKTELLTVWRVYNRGESTAVYRSFLEDSIFFNAYGYSRSDADAGLINYKDALYEISYNSGKKFLEEISPHWQEIERIYFDYYSKDMQKANKYAAKSLWRKAAQVWRPVAEQQKGAKTAYAAYNMALASEMAGQLDLAMYWLKKALSIRPDNYYFLQYQNQLQKRISRQETIDSQLAG